MSTGLGIGKPKPSASAGCEHDLARVEAELKGSTASVLPLDLSVQQTETYTSSSKIDAPIDLTSKASASSDEPDRSTRLDETTIPVTPDELVHDEDNGS